MSFGPESFDESSILFSHDRPMGLLERLGYFKQLVFSRTRLEFRLLWNKVFQKEDEELGWLLNPYRQSTGRNCEATMMSSFNKNIEESYQQFDFHEASNFYGREKVTIYNRGVAKKTETRKKNEEKKSFTENAIQLARYMGMGVYLTSTSFPSPFFPVNDTNIYQYDETCYSPQNIYSPRDPFKIWSKELDRRAAIWAKDFDSSLKLSLLGPAGVGKTTIFKQMKMIVHFGGFSPEERQQKVKEIRSNLLESIRELTSCITASGDQLKRFDKDNQMRLLFESR